MFMITHTMSLMFVLHAYTVLHIITNHRRLKEKMLKERFGDWKTSFRYIPRLLERFRAIDLESTLDLVTKDHAFFRAFAAPSASKTALRFCRPVIGMDGSFLIRAQRATLLVAAAKDGNNQLVPLAYGLCESENKDSWKWFCENLLKHIPSWPTTQNASLISDRDKGLIPAVKEVFPLELPHYFCSWHLEQNVLKFGPNASEAWQMPLQQNEYDCGIFVCQYIQALVEACFEEGRLIGELTAAGHEIPPGNEIRKPPELEVIGDEVEDREWRAEMAERMHRLEPGIGGVDTGEGHGDVGGDAAGEGHVHVGQVTTGEGHGDAGGDAVGEGHGDVGGNNAGTHDSMRCAHGEGPVADVETGVAYAAAAHICRPSLSSSTMVELSVEERRCLEGLPTHGVARIVEAKRWAEWRNWREVLGSLPEPSIPTPAGVHRQAPPPFSHQHPGATFGNYHPPAAAFAGHAGQGRWPDIFTVDFSQQSQPNVPRLRTGKRASNRCPAQKICSFRASAMAALMDIQAARMGVSSRQSIATVRSPLTSQPLLVPCVAPAGRVLGSRRPLHRSLRAMAGQDGRQPWDLGRFARTVFFFNEPPSLDSLFSSLVTALTGAPASPAPVAAADTGGREGGELVLVVGATGGVGKRVVELLRARGVPVRALVRQTGEWGGGQQWVTQWPLCSLLLHVVRNLDKAQSLLGEDVDVVAADVTQIATLQPAFFRGVTAVVNACAVTVGPKEGDTADRQKYYQGIKFYDPQIIGDTPEAVEYTGVANLLARLRPQLAAAAGCHTIFSLTDSGEPVGALWGALDDVVMGGVSESALQYDKTAGEGGLPAALFTGTVSTANSGGFVSVRTKNLSPALDLSAYEGLEVRVRGDGQRYKLILRTTAAWDALGYTASFDTLAGSWHTVRLPFSSFAPVFRARTVPGAPPLDTSNIASLQLMLSKFEYDGRLNPSFTPGPFTLPLTSIAAYPSDPSPLPRIVHVGSAGVTRPKRPGLDLSRQPPAVRMNDELGGILTWKLRGEDLVHASGLPFTVVRPCALTEEPVGAPLLFDQGDNITGKIGRAEVARICVEALSSPAAANKTFEVKSTVPFSEPFTVDPSNPPTPCDTQPFFAALQPGITGKELLEENVSA
ncbi:unnamed protein product [Closterium sp. NIES-65]|nr:unnamed protein product [Closterium sp. NIES-65]